MSQRKHSPLPWAVDDRRRAPLKNIRIIANIQSATPHEVAWVSDVHQRDRLGGYNPRTDSDAADAKDAVGLANADFIVEACNNYERVLAERDELRQAARNLRRRLRQGGK